MKLLQKFETTFLRHSVYQRWRTLFGHVSQHIPVLDWVNIYRGLSLKNLNTGMVTLMLPVAILLHQLSKNIYH